MAEVRCRPIDHWVGEMLDDWTRRRTPFSVRWDRLLAEMERELDYLDATDVTVGLDCTPSQIRMDGWPKGGAAIPDPVVLTFASRVGPLRFQCDRFYPWQANLRAIGLLLQRLRLVDECGVGRSEQAYTGWQALPPGRPMGAAMTIDEAARLLAVAPDTARPAISAAWRQATKDAHPDAGGDAAEFRRLTEARDLLLGQGDRANA